MSIIYNRGRTYLPKYQGCYDTLISNTYITIFVEKQVFLWYNDINSNKCFFISFCVCKDKVSSGSPVWSGTLNTMTSCIK